MGQSFVPVPAGWCCIDIGYGATQSQVISGAVSATFSRCDAGDLCIHSLISQALICDYAVSGRVHGGARHV